MPKLQNPHPIGGKPLVMASREHSGVRASLPPVAEDGLAEETSRAAVNGPHESSTFMGTPSDGLGCLEDSRPAGRPAPTPLAASLLEGGLASRAGQF